jgi:hypothetical protein
MAMKRNEGPRVRLTFDVALDGKNLGLLRGYGCDQELREPLWLVLYVAYNEDVPLQRDLLLLRRHRADEEWGH